MILVPVFNLFLFFLLLIHKGSTPSVLGFASCLPIRMCIPDRRSAFAAEGFQWQIIWLVTGELIRPNLWTSLKLNNNETPSQVTVNKFSEDV